MSGIKEHPWLAKAPVVRAILCGRQTQDRRPLKTQVPPFERDGNMWFIIKGKHYRTGNFYYDQKDGSSLYPFGMDELVATLPWQPGTHIWIRETFRAWCTDLTGTIRDGQWSVRYAADNAVRHNASAWDHDCAYSPHELNKHVELVKWTPSIHMPRWASRITLLVKRVWVERLQSITEEDAIAEGVVQPDLGTYGMNPETLFRDLWNSCYPDPALQWDANPWIVATEFERITP